MFSKLGDLFAKKITLIFKQVFFLWLGAVPILSLASGTSRHKTGYVIQSLASVYCCLYVARSQRPGSPGESPLRRRAVFVLENLFTISQMGRKKREDQSECFSRKHTIRLHGDSNQDPPWFFTGDDALVRRTTDPLVHFGLDNIASARIELSIDSR